VSRRPGPQVYLARHGQTAYNLEGRFQGQQAIPLDGVGRDQARELAERAVSYGFVSLWSSPLLRARETATIVGERIGLEVREDDRLMETDAGDWTDLSFAEVQAREPERFEQFVTVDPTFSFPGGESFAEQDVRVAAAIGEVRPGPPPALVVCHGMVIRAALATHVGHPIETIKRVANAALVPLDLQAAEQADLGGGAATVAT